jgi:predicted HTH domain antitoxin
MKNSYEFGPLRFNQPMESTNSPIIMDAIQHLSESNQPARFIDQRCYSEPMEITVKLPDDLAQHPNPGREALESLVIEGYRCGALSHSQGSQLLGFSRFEFDAFLKERNIYDHAYDVADLKQDEETLGQLQSKGLLQR